MNPMAWSLSGAVLAGGESRRMGRDKAMLDFQGTPLWRRQLTVLREAGAEPVAVVRRNGQARLDECTPHLRDTVEGAGPLAGLHAALVAARTHWIAVLAVDMPQIDAAWFRWLGQFCRTGAGAVVQIPSGFEPLAAIYPREAITLTTSHLRSENRSLQDLIASLVQSEQMAAIRLPESEHRRLANWNRPTDLMCEQSAIKRPPNADNRP